MWSRSFALLVRALRVDARQLSSHLARLALLVFVVLLLMFGQFMSVAWGAPGLWFFTFLSWVNYFFATLASALLFATAITEEKEEQTRGLLRMANVGAGSLLLGKGGPRLLAALLILTAQFPFTLLAITLGGVSWDQVRATYCTLFSHIVFVGGVGLFCSVLCRRSFGAASLTIVVILTTLIVPAVVNGLVFLAATAGAGAGVPYGLVAAAEFALPFSQKLYQATATARLNQILTTGFADGPIGFQVISNLGIGLGLFGLSWLSFEPFNRNLEHAVSAGRSADGGLTRLRRRCRRAWAVPLIWKDFYYLAGGPAGWVARSFVYGLLSFLCVWLGTLLSNSAVEPEDVGRVLITLTMYLFLPVEGIVLAARVYRSETRERTWSTLMQLPRSLSSVAYPKLAGCLLGLAPLALYLSLGLVLAPSTIYEFRRDILGDPTGILAFACVVAHFLLFFHFTTLYSVLINAWLGAMLAIATSFVIALGQIAVTVCTLMILVSNSSGMGTHEEVIFRILLSVSTVLLVAAAVAVHYLIGVRLRDEAAS